MDAFESIIAEIHEHDGFWTQMSFKVELTREDKIQMERQSSPRWEIDVLAYRPGDNLLRVIECKSYLDSTGVRLKAFDPTRKAAKRMKLFNEDKTREVVLKRLLSQLEGEKKIRKNSKVQLCLAAGKIVKSEHEQIRAFFTKRDWQLFDRDWIQHKLHAIANGGFENTILASTTKLLLKEQ